MAISLPRIFLASEFLRLVSSLPLNKTAPLIWVFFLGSKPIIAKEVTDLPEPDSPTIPTISFSLTENEMSWTTSIGFLAFPKEIERALMERSNCDKNRTRLVNKYTKLL